MNMSRLTRGHAIAAVAALLLLLVTAVDWWSSDAGEDARRTEGLAQPEPGEGPEQRQFDSDIRSDASIQAEQAERNAWQPDGALDLVVLLLVLASVAAALAAAALRAAERRAPPGAIVAAVAMLAALAIALDVVRTGTEAGGQVKLGAPLALIALAALAFGSARAAREDEGEEPAAAADGARTSAAS